MGASQRQYPVGVIQYSADTSTTVSNDKLPGRHSGCLLQSFDSNENAYSQNKTESFTLVVSFDDLERRTEFDSKRGNNSLSQRRHNISDRLAAEHSCPLQCDPSIFTALKHLHNCMIVSSHTVSISHCVQRGGKDLAKRHARLSLEISSSQFSALLGNQSMKNKRSSVVRTFQGLKVPQKPLPPTAEECCMSRCEMCVHDLYVMSLQRYHQALRELHKTLAEMQVSPKEWPIEIRIGGTHSEDTMDKEQLAATEAAWRAFRDMNSVEGRQSRRTRELWFEAMKMVIWVLWGCRG